MLIIHLILAAYLIMTAIATAISFAQLDDLGLLTKKHLYTVLAYNALFVVAWIVGGPLWAATLVVLERLWSTASALIVTHIATKALEREFAELDSVD